MKTPSTEAGSLRAPDSDSSDLASRSKVDRCALPEGVFGKYVLRKASGAPLDPDACYFVLRLDKDIAAQAAAMEYARHTPNRTLADDLFACLYELGAPCSCRSVGDQCARHPMFSAVWRAGKPAAMKEQHP